MKTDKVIEITDAKEIATEIKKLTGMINKLAQVSASDSEKQIAVFEGELSNFYKKFFEAEDFSSREDFLVKEVYDLAVEVIGRLLASISPTPAQEALLSITKTIIIKFYYYLMGNPKISLLHFIAAHPIKPSSLPIAKNLLEIFFEAPFDFNIQDIKGQTVAHVAVENENSLLLPYLIEYGCGINRVNKQGFTPLDIYSKKEGGDTLFLKILKDNGAETAKELSAKVPGPGERLPAWFGESIPDIPDLYPAYLRSLVRKIDEIKTSDPKGPRVFYTEEELVAFWGTLDHVKELIKTPPSPDFNPNYTNVGLNSPGIINMGFLAIHNMSDQKEEKDQIGILLLKRYLLRGLNLWAKVPAQTGREITIFDELIAQHRIAPFLADKTIRAALLSSSKFEFPMAYYYLSREQKENQVRAKKKIQQDAMKQLIAEKAALQEEKPKSPLKTSLPSASPHQTFGCGGPS